jgi:8-oxo-dGTP pyrophosphatase MutT (NUDIX family)
MKCRAAGIIIYRHRKINMQIEFLGLAATEYFAKISKGIYDVPKGQINPGEIPFDCAKRECLEETGLIYSDIEYGPYKDDGLWLWLTECNGNPSLGINPHTRLHEHLDYAWLSPEEMENTCFDYLAPSIRWARKLLNI